MDIQLLITRPADQAAIWVDGLKKHGISAHALPLLAIEALADSSAVQAAWRGMLSYQLVIFVSPSAVTKFFALKPDPDHGFFPKVWPATLRVASPGPGTTASLLDHGVPAAVIVEPEVDAQQFDSEALWQKLRVFDWRSATVLVVSGETGRDWLTQQLKAQGAHVDRVVAYRRMPSLWTPELQALTLDALARPACHLWLFSSSEAIGHLIARYPLTQWARSMAMATHPRIAQAATNAGFSRVYTSAPTLAAVVTCLQSAANQNQL